MSQFDSDGATDVDHAGEKVQPHAQKQNLNEEQVK